MANSETVEIAPGGDVVLICAAGEDTNTPTRLRVSSQVLSLASPVFKILLGRKFREGNTLASNGYIEIPLPEDDAITMAFLCKVMHYDSTTMGSVPDASEAVRVGILVDKYDCSTAISHAAFFWISANSHEFELAQTSELLVAAYLLRQEKLFSKVSGDLVMKSEKDIDAPEAAVAAGLQMLYVHLNRQRIDKLHSILEFTEKRIHYEAKTNRILEYSGCSVNAKCTYEALRARTMVNMLVDAKLWPSINVIGASVQVCIDRLHEFDTKLLLEIALCSTKCEGMTFQSPQEVAIMFREEAKIFKKDSLRFCLTCVREGNMECQKDPCHHVERD